jgi:hypothetical protein
VDMAGKYEVVQREALGRGWIHRAGTASCQGDRSFSLDVSQVSWRRCPVASSGDLQTEDAQGNP